MYLIRGSVGALALFLPIRRRIKKTKTKQNKLRLAAPTTTATAAATTSATNVFFCFFVVVEAVDVVVHCCRCYRLFASAIQGLGSRREFSSWRRRGCAPTAILRGEHFLSLLRCHFCMLKQHLAIKKCKARTVRSAEGGKSLLCDLGSELRLGGKTRATIINGTEKTQKQKNMPGTV